MRAELEEALQAASGGDMERALDRALAAWRARRSPILAEVIDAVAERIGAPPIEARASAWHAAWFTREEARRAADLGPLLRALPGPPDGSGKWIEAFQRLERLEGWPDDPRLSAGLVDLFERQPMASARTAPFHRIAARLVTRVGDARALGALRVIRERFRSFLEPAIVEAIAGLERALAGGVPALSPEEEALARALQRASRGPGPSLDELLARVHADPDDDGARAAYAEALVARGDPRGEHILLSLRRHAGEALSAEEGEREAKLLKANERPWLGPLEPIISSFTARFERGFPVSAGVIGDVGRFARLRGHPAWSTLREIDLTYVSPGLVHPIFRNLRLAKGVRDEDLIAFATTEAGASLEEIEWRGPAIDERGAPNDAALRALADPAALPRLRRLRCHPQGHAHGLGARDLAALLDTAIVRRVEQLGCASGASSLARWLEALAGREGALAAKELEITPEDDYAANLVLRIGRGADGRFSVLRAVLGAHERSASPIAARRSALADLSNVLWSIPESALTSLHIEGDREADPEPEQLRKLEQAIGLFSGLDAASRREIAERSAWASGRAASPPDSGEATTEDWARLVREHLAQRGASLMVRVDPHEIALGALTWHPWSGRPIAAVSDVVAALCAAAMLLEGAPVPEVDASPIERRLAELFAAALVLEGDRLVIQIQEEGWTGPHDKGLVTSACGSIPIDRLPREKARFAALVERLEAAANGMRTTAIRTCRFCLQTFSPVDMHDRTTCHDCAGQWLGVIH